MAFIDEPMDTESSGTEKTRMRSSKASSSPLLPEVDAYLHLLVLVKLIDAWKYEAAAKCSDALMTKVVAQNRRTSDLIAAKCYFYHSRAYELTNKLDAIRG